MTENPGRQRSPREEHAASSSAGAAENPGRQRSPREEHAASSSADAAENPGRQRSPREEHAASSSAGAAVIRPEAIEDCAEAAELHVLAWQVGYKGLLPDDYLANLDPEVWATVRRDRLGQNIPRQSLIAETNGRISGFVIFGDKRDGTDHPRFHPETGEIYAIYVHPDFWGTGVADELMRAALSGLTQSEVQLWVLEENHRARRFYARYGLYPDGTREFYQARGTDVQAPELRLSMRR